VTTAPFISVRKTGRTWTWRCNNDHCGWVGTGLTSQQAALREACRHLVDDFEQHHGMTEVRPSYSEIDDRYTATCHCGYGAEEKSENGAEHAIEMHAEWLRIELPARTVA
jgi:hypothetical protein